MTLRRFLRSGWEGRGAPGLARSVRVGYRFDETDAPRGRYPFARRLPALLGPSRLAGLSPLRTGRGADVPACRQ